VTSPSDPCRASNDHRLVSLRPGVKRHLLTTCYRQKSEIGKPVKAILETIAESTPSGKWSNVSRFYASHRQQLAEATTLEFTNEGGTFEVRQGDRDRAWAELAQLFRSEFEAGRLWEWAPAILILRGERVARLPKGGLGLFEGLPVASHRLNDYRHFKGLEFQHSIILLTQDEWSLLNRLQQGRRHAFDQQRRCWARRCVIVPWRSRVTSVVDDDISRGPGTGGGAGAGEMGRRGGSGDRVPGDRYGPGRRGPVGLVGHELGSRLGITGDGEAVAPYRPRRAVGAVRSIGNRVVGPLCAAR
jgi:hypothetical protein